MKRGVDAHPFDPRDKPLAELVARKFDRVFIALHGPGGEDGTLQGALEFLGLPYTGSGVMGSAIGMDKLRTKRLAQAVGIPTTDYMVLRSPADLDNCIERLGLPDDREARDAGFLGRHDQGREGRPVVRRLPGRRDARARRVRRAVDHGRANTPSRCCRGARCRRSASRRRRRSTTTRRSTSAPTRSTHCPSGLSAEAEKHLANLAQATFTAVGAEGWGRADFMMDKAGKPYLLEINTVPGMTDHSLVPMAARALDINFEQLVWQVLETCFTAGRCIA